ncbi:hypothetical protein [Deinococcus hohokamensis]|uniref:Uncharacterized protein n=1 Tax=Deinococcus hohokamensis TaxID=309883 RepID=A0ABV9I4E9_9DEIO
MTAPALTEAQMAKVKTYATAAAFNYHNSEVPADDRVDLPTSFLVHGDLKLVAADVLDAACLQASKGAATGSGGVKRVKIEGELEVEKFARTSVDSVTATAWRDQATRLRAEVKAASAGGGRMVASPVATMHSGNLGGPVFRISSREREPR